MERGRDLLPLPVAVSLKVNVFLPLLLSLSPPLSVYSPYPSVFSHFYLTPLPAFITPSLPFLSIPFSLSLFCFPQLNPKRLFWLYK